MKPITRKEIEDAINELKDAMIESIELDEADKKIKLKKQKSHYRLQKAREEVRLLKVDL